MVQGVLLVVVLVRDAVPLMLNKGSQATHCFVVVVVVVVMVLFQTMKRRHDCRFPSPLLLLLMTSSFK